MINLLNILVTPVETLGKIASRPRWLIPTMFYAVTFFLLLWLGGCWQNLADGLRLSAILGPALISPLIVGIVSLGSTMFVLLMNMVVGGNADRTASFRTLFSVNVHCGIIFLLGEIVNFLLVRTSFFQDYSFPIPNRFPIGLDAILLGSNAPNLYLTILLHSTSIFIVWYLVVLWLGIRISTDSGRARSAVIVALLWCAVVATALGAAYAAGGTTTIRVAM